MGKGMDCLDTVIWISRWSTGLDIGCRGFCTM